MCLPRDDGGPGTSAERLAAPTPRSAGSWPPSPSGPPLVVSPSTISSGATPTARAFLDALLVPPIPPAVLIIGTYRTEEADQNPHLRDIVALASLRVALPPLTAVETEELGASFLSADAGDGGAAARAAPSRARRAGSPSS